MTPGTFARRFLVFGPLVTLYYFMKYHALVSPKAEVEVSPNLLMGRGTRVGSFTKIKASRGRLRIGRDVQIALNCFIASDRGGIDIGDDCLIGPSCSIMADSYRYGDLNTPFRLQGQESKGVKIGANVWLGAGAVVLDGSSIGNGVIVTANSVVSGKIPDNVIVQGNPAQIVFRRR